MGEIQFLSVAVSAVKNETSDVLRVWLRAVGIATCRLGRGSSYRLKVGNYTRQ